MRAYNCFARTWTVGPFRGWPGRIPFRALSGRGACRSAAPAGLLLLVFGMNPMGTAAVAGAPSVEVTGPWQVRVSPGTVAGTTVRVFDPVALAVAPADEVDVKDERYDSLPLFDDKAAPWSKGARLRGVITMETTAPDRLDPQSVVLKPGPGDQAPFKPGVDYGIDSRWGTFGRLPDGAIHADQPVWASYSYGRSRIDSIVVDSAGHVSLLEGSPDIATPHPPQPAPGEVVIANVWIPGRLSALTADNLYPIVEPRYPEPATADHPPAETLLPKTWAKLQNGQPLHILAWGDSVTAGGQASDMAHRYQERFVTLLGQRFPKASLQLTTVAWGGRNSDNFLREPQGSPYNFQEKVLDPHPDLVVMEFVNDAYLTPDQVEERYSALLQRFKDIGADWIILTPHYVWPEWMGKNTSRITEDPRPYVAGLRQFAARHHVALADASLRWGRLLEEGIPYVTLLSNSLNHPDDRGHEIFARSLMELFGGGEGAGPGRG